MTVVRKREKMWWLFSLFTSKLEPARLVCGLKALSAGFLIVVEKKGQMSTIEVASYEVSHSQCKRKAERVRKTALPDCA